MSIGDFLESLSQAILVGCNVSREIGRKVLDRTDVIVDVRRNDGVGGQGPTRKDATQESLSPDVYNSACDDSKP